MKTQIEEAARVARFLQDHLHWSACWDKRRGVWRVAEDDPDSDLYAESLLRQRQVQADLVRQGPGAAAHDGRDDMMAE